MQKLQRDRSFLQELMSDTMEELAAKGTFTSLTDKVQECHSEKRRMEETILQLVRSHTFTSCRNGGIIVIYCSIFSEESCRKRVRQLKHELVQLKKQREEELTVCINSECCN
jgi:hypothetical protein